MAIKLSVIGLFFEADLEMEGPQKVLDVLMEANRLANLRKILRGGKPSNVSNFGYTLDVDHNGEISATSFKATYIGSVNGRAVGGKYPAGVYELPGNPDAKPVKTVWQYYVLDADKKPYFSSPPVRFLGDPKAIVPENGCLIWRLVSILSGPTSPLPPSSLAQTESAF